ncbi:MAG TPA: hypothetical protein VKU88_03480, partial [Acidimicrobiales bacterium]|nr:hypothetical protein [Acidimicrobiales bacterium]
MKIRHQDIQGPEVYRQARPCELIQPGLAAGIRPGLGSEAAVHVGSVLDPDHMDDGVVFDQSV